VNITRYLHDQVARDLKEKMVFLGGPRQVGKTTVARAFVSKDDRYLSWDDVADRRRILKGEFSVDGRLYALDEIHKYARWRSLLKGNYDKYFPRLNFLVAGSARLDHFRKGGDSLVGRYHYLRLHPLSLREVDRTPSLEATRDLLRYGGFPEPFLRQDEVFLRRWQTERRARVTTQDLRDLENVKDISLIELLVESLGSRVAQPLSIKSLQEDLSVSPNSVERWIEILESLYYCYRITPYGPPKIKAVKKTRKLYYWDWSEAEDPGARFENLVASQLLKFCHFQEDTLGIKTELRYFRDVVTGKEIDFIVLQKGKPLFAVECKTGEKALSASLAQNGKRLGIPRLFQVHLGTRDFGAEATGRVLPFHVFATELGLP
jgi:predicted AAA+ superfamily ATPase